MDDLLGMQIGEAIENAFGYLSQDLLTRTPAQFLDLPVYTVEGSSFTIFHGDGDGGSAGFDERAIISADMFGCTVLVETQFTDNLLLHVGVRVGGNDLRIEILARCLSRSQGKGDSEEELCRSGWDLPSRQKLSCRL